MENFYSTSSSANASEALHDKNLSRATLIIKSSKADEILKSSDAADISAKAYQSRIEGAKNIGMIRDRLKEISASLNTEMDSIMQRLSSGKRINSGADDSAGLAMSAKIKSSSLSSYQGERNTNDAITMLQVFSSAGETIVDILLEMKELAMLAASSQHNQSSIHLSKYRLY
jgi:hypothetical protein